MCPFCGEAARSKEHVWPKWLRQYPAYRLMNAGRSGERFASTEYRGGGSESPSSSSSTKHVADFLPHVTADVCARCNNGWMSSMESQVRRFLDGVMRGLTGRFLREDAQRLLAAWFSKCVYCYAAALFSDENRVWSLTDYEALRLQQTAAPTATIWMGVSDGLRRDIVLSLTPVHLVPLTAAAASRLEDRPALASAWLSANGVVFYGIWMLPEMVAAGEPLRFGGAEVDTMVRIWPPTDPKPFPSEPVPDAAVVTLIDRLADLRDEGGVPVETLSETELEAVKATMRAGLPGLRDEAAYAIAQRRLLTRPEAVAERDRIVIDSRLDGDPE